MGSKLSRRKIAAYFADELIAGRNVTKPLAAYLVETRRLREAELVVRDIESALADRGVLLADVATARQLTSDTQKEITDYLKQATNTKTVYVRSHIDPFLLGGARIDIPGARKDTTLRYKLNQLTASKV